MNNMFEQIRLGERCMHSFGQTLSKFHNMFEGTFFILRYSVTSAFNIEIILTNKRKARDFN